MPSTDQPDPVRRPFATTNWSLVVAAAADSSPEAHAALAKLCESYWYPLYAYVRRRGYQTAEAQDLTQEFIARLLERDQLRLADQDRGKFRSFLLASIDHFLANQWRDARAQKRGGGRMPVSIDFAVGESRYDREPADAMTPERIYERRWAMTLLECAVSRLESEFGEAGKGEHFAALRAYLGGDQEQVPYREIAEQLKMTEGAVKVAVHRMRRRCRELLRDEISQTVATPGEIDDELQHLFRAVQ